MTTPTGSPPGDDPAPGERPGSPPPPLVVAASLTGLEGVATIVVAILQVAVFSPERAVMGASTALFFVIYGVGLLVAAWQLWRRHSLARGPVVLAQLLWLGLAWSFRGGETTVVAVVLAVVALVTIAGVLHPASIRALEA